MNELDVLFDTVVRNGYCIGCGTCTAVDRSPIVIALDEWGQYQAMLPESSLGADADPGPDVLAVCPFSDQAADEDTIGRDLFPDATPDPSIGYHVATFAGFVAEESFRSRGSSGGMGKWITYELMRRGLVDAVIHVVQSEPEGPDATLYRYGVVRSLEEVKEGSKSVYYPVEMSGILADIKASPGRYAIVGVPCFIKAVRLLARRDPVIKDRVAYCIGLVCGHLKSTKYAEMIAWQRGIAPGYLRSIDFRKKLPGTRANQKGVEVVGRSEVGETRSEGIVQEFFGTKYPHGFFMYNACDYCDDVTSETADLVVGDAWLPQYVADGGGTNVVIVRNAELLGVVKQGISDGRLNMHPLSAEDVARSQSGGLRHRREGLAYRLHLKDKGRQWRPKKRVSPRFDHIDRTRRKLYRVRMQLTRTSHRWYREAADAGSLDRFLNRMQKLIDQYNKLSSGPRLPIGQRLKWWCLGEVRRRTSPELRQALKSVLQPLSKRVRNGHR